MTAYGQANDKDVFASVPTPLRARLVERLKMLVEYQHTQQWEKQYDLLSAAATQGDSKEDHVKRLQRWYAEGLGDILIDFTPKSVTYGSGAPFDAVIFGCAKLREKENIVELYASVEAYRENDDWFFSPIGVVTPVGGKPKPCPYSTSSTATRSTSRCSTASGKKSSEGRQR
jgi:hypothetical protein